MVYKFVGASNEDDTLNLLSKYVDEYTLKASDPIEFNDPHEFKVRIKWDATEEEIRDQYFEDNPHKTEEEFKRWRKSIDSGNLEWWSSQTGRANILQYHGVTSFAGTLKNHLLWSHYGSSHKGFCIAFDEEELANIGGHIASGPVRYQEESPIFNPVNDDGRDAVKKSFFCKSPDWSYESEYRVVFDTKGEVNFPETAIKAVYLGCRSDSKVSRYCKERLEMNIDFFQMVEDLSRYKMNIRPLEENVGYMSSHH